MNIFEKILFFIQTLIDNINSAVEPCMMEIQRYAETYPNAFGLVAFFFLFIVLVSTAMLCMFVFYQD